MLAEVLPEPEALPGSIRAVRRVLLAVFRDDRIHVRSGFLALWALESVIPLFALTAAIAGWVGRRDAMIAWVEHGLAASIFGNTSEAAARWLTSVLDQVTFDLLGVFGVLSALFVLWQLYVATVFDLGEIGRSASRSNGVLGHFALFAVFLVWLGALMIGGCVATGWMVANGRWELSPLVWMGTSVTLAAGPLLFTRRTPPPLSLFVGAAVGATWLELLKGVFVVYSTSSFGSDALALSWQHLAFAPLAFLWMHLVWFSVLLAAVVARVHAEGEREGEPTWPVKD